MAMYWKLALKNIFRQKKRTFTLGVNYAIVTFILVLLLAFSQGARVNITSNLVRASAGHITVAGQYIAGGRVFQGVLRYPQVQQVARRTLGQELTVLPRYIVRSSMYSNGLSKRVTFVGIDTAIEEGFRDQIRFLAGSWQEFLDSPNGVVLPAEAAKYFELAYGDDVLVSTRTRFGAFNTATFRVQGIYQTGNFFIQNQLLAHFEFLRKLDLAEADAASVLYVYLPGTSGLGEKRDRLVQALQQAGFEARAPKDENSALAAVTAASPRYELDSRGVDRVELTVATIGEVLGIVRSVLAAVNAIGALIAVIMLFIIAVSIFINMRMAINERLREIGTMRAIGVEARGVTGLFVLENVLLALIFTLAGVVLALLTVLVVRTAVPLPASGNLGLFLNRERLALAPRIGDILLILAVTTGFTALFSFFPARRGGRIRPVEALTRVF
jgi:ABC-type lipoprotein release transport system permease subunit